MSELTHFNVYILSNNPQTCAQMLCDEHIKRTCYEDVAVIYDVLSDRKALERAKTGALGQSPVFQWLIKDQANFFWYHQYAVWCFKEAIFRQCITDVPIFLTEQVRFRENAESYLPSRNSTETVPAAYVPDICLNAAGIVDQKKGWAHRIQVYQRFYNWELNKYVREVSWRIRSVPDWFRPWYRCPYGKKPEPKDSPPDVITPTNDRFNSLFS